MKKLIILLTMIMVIGLSACSDSPAPVIEDEPIIETITVIEYVEYDDTDIIARIVALEESDLQAQVDLINTQIDAFIFYNDTEIQAEIDLLTEALDNLAIQYSALILVDESYEDDINLLNTAIADLTIRIDNLVVITGLGGITSIYENSTVEQELTTMYTMSVIHALTISVEQLKDTIDKDKAPSYILDELGEYISFDQMARLLNAKYFDLDLQYLTEFDMGSQAYFRFQFTATDRMYLDEFDEPYYVEITNEEMIARAILLIEELRLYAFYFISCPELMIEVYRDNGITVYPFYISIPLGTALSDFVTITPDGIYDSDYEMELFSWGTYDTVLIQQYYDEFVLSGEFTGYVLNYK